jgi:hypothetical protein
MKKRILYMGAPCPSGLAPSRAPSPNLYTDLLCLLADLTPSVFEDPPPGIPVPAYTRCGLDIIAVTARLYFPFLCHRCIKVRSCPSPFALSALACLSDQDNNAPCSHPATIRCHPQPWTSFPQASEHFNINISESHFANYLVTGDEQGRLIKRPPAPPITGSLSSPRT